MTWKQIEGYRSPYRISDRGEVQRQKKDGSWVRMCVYLSRSRAHVDLRRADGTRQKVAVVRLMDTYFLGGRAKREGLRILHRNGAKLDCAVENLVLTTQSEIGKRWGGTGRRKPVVRRDRNGAETLYASITNAAKANGLCRPELYRRLNGEVLDPRGYRFERLEGDE